MRCSAKNVVRQLMSWMKASGLVRAVLFMPLLGVPALCVGNIDAVAATDKECLAIWAKPEIKIEVVRAKPKLNHRKSSDQIERVAKKSGYAKSTRHASLLGLTHSSIGPSLGTATKYKVIKPGKYCLRLEEVRLTFGSRKTSIYIDRKYRKDSCAYNAIYAHEMEHVRINERVINEYIPKIKTRATGAG